VAKDGPQAGDLIQKVLGTPAVPIHLPDGGDVVAAGPLVQALDGPGHDLARIGLATAMKRVGFQMHDGQIYLRLTERGGVLVAVRSDPRAAEALATLFSYGGGNAAIGAWAGRL
jgi:hypothetical protein